MTTKKFKGVYLQKASGRYMASYYVRLPNGKKLRKMAYGKTEEEADANRAKILKTIQATSTPKLISNNYVDGFLMKWVQETKGIKESTRRGYEITIRRHINPRLGKMRLSELDVSTVQWAMDDIVEKGGSNNTTKIAKIILSKALKRAEIDYLVTPNIMTHIELEACRHKKKALMTSEDVNKFLTIIKGNPYELFFLLYVYYGLRRGEAIPLKWSDIDFEKKEIHIEHQYSKNGKNLEVYDLKSETSHRVLPLIPVIEVYLRKLDNNHNTDRYIITGEDGKLPTPYQVDWQFQKIKKQLGRMDICLHSLRGSVATMLKDLHVPVKDAQEILGHSTPIITMQYYQQTTIDNKRSALNTLANSFNKNS